MLALRSTQDLSGEDNKTSEPATCTPNIIPCRVHHDGPVEVSKRYWNPVKDDNGKTWKSTDCACPVIYCPDMTIEPKKLMSKSINAGEGQTAYFRGRKLRGRRVELPDGYEGELQLSQSEVISIIPDMCFYH
jgi:ribonuclease H2 subunit C